MNPHPLSFWETKQSILSSCRELDNIVRTFFEFVVLLRAPQLKSKFFSVEKKNEEERKAFCEQVEEHFEQMQVFV